MECKYKHLEFASYITIYIATKIINNNNNWKYVKVGKSDLPDSYVYLKSEGCRLKGRAKVATHVTTIT